MRPFLIVGANKTGTSTACAVSNTYEKAFCLYEADFSKPDDHGRNADLVKYLPECANLFAPKPDIPKCLQRIHVELETRGHVFDFIGRKIAGIRPDILSSTTIPTLMIIRDVRFWAAKHRVIADQIGKGDATPVITSYIATFIMSFLNPNVRRVRLEDSFRDPNSMPNAIARLLGVENSFFCEWWNKTSWTETSPKNYSSWIQGHSSAFMPPVFSDTQASLAKHSFWEATLPLFDKYYERIDQSFRETDVLSDLDAINAVWGAFPMSLNEGYESKVNRLIHNDDGGLIASADEGVEKKSNENWNWIKPPDL